MSPAERKKHWSRIQANLRVGDVLLFRSKSSFLSRLIRLRTGSYWNHSALVFETNDVILIGSPLIAEAFSAGIEIHQLRKYADNLEEYDIGVKRFPGLKESERIELVKSFILNNIDAPYDYGRMLAYLVGPWIAAISQPLFYTMQKYLFHSDMYICSTFIHKAFHNFQKNHRASHFRDAQYNYIESEEMYTPGDIARNEEFEWIFNPHT